MVDEIMEMRADLYKKYNMCSECGEKLIEFNHYDNEGYWIETTIECLNCGDEKIVN
jgi:hypothetical protein